MRLSIGKILDHRIVISQGDAPMQTVSFGRARPSEGGIERGRALVAMRRLRGVDQSTLAAAVGLDPALLNAIELGLIEPRLRVLQQIAHALDCNAAAFAFGSRVVPAPQSQGYCRAPVFTGPEMMDCLEPLSFDTLSMGRHSFEAMSLIAYRFAGPAPKFQIECGGYVVARLDHGRCAGEGRWLTRVGSNLEPIYVGDGSFQNCENLRMRRSAEQLIGPILRVIASTHALVGCP